MHAGFAARPTQPARDLRTTRLILLFLIVSFALALCCVCTRNIYDDEHTSLNFVHLYTSQIIQTANSSDVHPPGMYLLTHYAFEAIPSPRWMTLFVVFLLYAGLAVFVFALTPLFATLRGRICFLALATLSPQLLMWGLTFRWYGWWTPLALIVLVYAIQPMRVALPHITWMRSVVLAVLLAALFYLNYITLLFIVALAAALVFRYGFRPWKQYVVAFLVFLLLISLQLHAFYTVHLAGSHTQRASLLISFARLIQGLFVSEAFLPWHPIAIAALVCFGALIIFGALKIIRTWSVAGVLLTPQRGLAGIILFAVVFFLLITLSGLGMKPRNALILIATLAPLLALFVESLPSQVLQSGLLVFFLLWEGVGIEHLIVRRGLAKSNMNNHPEEVVAYIRQASSDCSVVVTYDPLLTLSLEESGMAHQLVVAPPGSTLAIRRPVFNGETCGSMDVYWVTSYLGGMGEGGEQLAKEMVAAESSRKGQIQTHDFSYDPDAARKRRFKKFGDNSDVPDFRYVVQSETISSTALSKILKLLPDYADASLAQN